jgi:hypothetical protein
VLNIEPRNNIPLPGNSGDHTRHKDSCVHHVLPITPDGKAKGTIGAGVHPISFGIAAQLNEDG